MFKMLRGMKHRKQNLRLVILKRAKHNFIPEQILCFSLQYVLARTHATGRVPTVLCIKCITHECGVVKAPCAVMASSIGSRFHPPGTGIFK